MYSSPVSLVLGFHGCDRTLGERILNVSVTHLDKSENDYDWLGHGIYFWEHNAARALEYARALARNPSQNRPAIKDPFVIGSIIDPGNCLNLLESDSLALVRDAYLHFSKITEKSGAPMPQNKVDHTSGELLRRDLDCAVIETLHNLTQDDPFDTVRGVFEEGPELYPNAGFRASTHVQLCVRNPRNIKGYFRLFAE